MQSGPGVASTVASSQAGAPEAPGVHGLGACPLQALRLGERPAQVLALARQQNKQLKVVGRATRPGALPTPMAS